MICTCEFCEIKNIFYATVKEAELEEFCGSRIEKEVRAGELIIRQGDPIKDFIYLKEGLVKLYRDTPNGRQIISLGIPKDFVSLLSVFAGNSYTYSVTALHNSIICILDMAEIRQLVSENGDFAMSMIATLNKASERILFNYLDLNQKRLTGRVAQVLLYFSDIFQSDDFEIPISRVEIAQLVGMTTENVVRTIAELRKDNIVDAYGKDINIKNRDMLVKIMNLN